MGRDVYDRIALYGAILFFLLGLLFVFYVKTKILIIMTPFFFVASFFLSIFVIIRNFFNEMRAIESRFDLMEKEVTDENEEKV